MHSSSYCIGGRELTGSDGVGVISYTAAFLWQHFLFACSDIYLCCRMYRLTTMNSVTDRCRTDWQTHDIIMPMDDARLRTVPRS